MFACGAFVAPLVARPFLRQATKILAVARSKLFRDEVEIAARDSWELWEIRSLYPMVGLTSLAVTPGYLICWMLERPKDKSKDVLVEKEDANANGIGCRRQITLKQSLNHKTQIIRWLLVGLMAVYYFAFIGVESSLRTFTSAFGVSSSLKLTRAQVAADSFSQFSAGIGSARLLLPHLCCQPCSRHPPLHLGENPSHPSMKFLCPGCSRPGCPWLSSSCSPLRSLPLSLGNSLAPHPWPRGGHGRGWGGLSLCQWHGRRTQTWLL